MVARQNNGLRRGVGPGFESRLASILKDLFRPNKGPPYWKIYGCYYEFCHSFSTPFHATAIMQNLINCKHWKRIFPSSSNNSNNNNSSSSSWTVSGMKCRQMKLNQFGRDWLLLSRETSTAQQRKRTLSINNPDTLFKRCASYCCLFYWECIEIVWEISRKIKVIIKSLLVSSFGPDCHKSETEARTKIFLGQGTRQKPWRHKWLQLFNMRDWTSLYLWWVCVNF